MHIADVNAQAVQEITAQYPVISATVGDISKPESLDILFSDMQTQLGGLDVLVNNAGIAGATAPVAEYPIDTWNAVVNLNLTGTFMVTQRAIPLLKQSSAGSIIVMSSLAGRFGYPNRVAYSTTKWGLVGFTKTLSLELGPHGITANSITRARWTGRVFNRSYGQPGRQKIHRPGRHRGAGTLPCGTPCAHHLRSDVPDRW